MYKALNGLASSYLRKGQSSGRPCLMQPTDWLSPLVWLLRISGTEPLMCVSCIENLKKLLCFVFFTKYLRNSICCIFYAVSWYFKKWSNIIHQFFFYLLLEYNCFYWIPQKHIANFAKIMFSSLNNTDNFAKKLNIFRFLVNIYTPNRNKI